MRIESQPIVKEIGSNTSGHQPNFHDCREKTLLRYAWLEQEDGIWHFLTSPFADPTDSVRKWSDEQEALDELEKEGWKIVRPYPEQFSKSSTNSLNGYGLKRTVH